MAAMREKNSPPNRSRVDVQTAVLIGDSGEKKSTWPGTTQLHACETEPLNHAGRPFTIKQRSISTNSLAL
jgi:hypothetical protein